MARDVLAHDSEHKRLRPALIRLCRTAVGIVMILNVPLTCTVCTFTMFSSLASLLPSALHINTNTDLPKQTVNPEETNKEDQENAYDAQTIQAQTISDQDPAKGKEKDVKSPSEVCRLFYC